MRNLPENQVHEVILESIADGVFTVDQDWTITSFNRAAEQITGIPRADAIGRKCFDVLRANICETACALRKTLESGRQRIDRRINILHRTGEKVPVSISTSILRDPDGTVIGGVETFRDLSAIEQLRKEIDNHYTSHDIISKNHSICQILDILPDIAASDSTVLIEGPTGSGKELFAKAIHNLSARSKRNYVAVNCAALPDTLLESELFGYKQGAFTDARKDKPGRFALAEGGTLLLDEIGDVSAALQVKLLRVLQEREFEPLGGTHAVTADVRVIAATNRPLAELVARGTLREDLYYRLNVVRMTLPPLAQRREDIPLLANHFLRQFSVRQGKTVETISADALDLLMRYDYPGNVRQLQNIIEHAVVVCRSTQIDAPCLPRDLTHHAAAAHSSGPLSDHRSPLTEAEAQTILAALERHGGRRAKTAAALGIDTSTLWRKLKKYGLTYP